MKSMVLQTQYQQVLKKRTLSNQQDPVGPADIHLKETDTEKHPYKVRLRGFRDFALFATVIASVN